MKGSIRFVISLLVISAIAGMVYPAQAQYDPQPVHHDYETALRLYEEGLYEQAVRRFQKFLDREPDRALQEEAFYYKTLSEIALDTLNYEIYANRFLMMFPTGHFASTILEDMAGRDYREGNYEDALTAFSQAYSIEVKKEEKARYLFQMAEAAQAMEDPDSSSTLYQKLADTYKDSEWAPRALYARGRLYLEQDSIDASAVVFEELGDRYPNHEVTRQVGTALGEMYYRQQNFERAIETLRSELPYLEEEALLKAILLIAESHNYLDQFDQAATQYRRYINLSEDEMQARPAHYGLGWVYHKQQVYHWAAESFGEAAPGDDELARKALYYKAVNRKLSGRYDLALETFQTFGDRYTEGLWVEEAYYEWGLTAFELGRYDLAIEVLQRLVRGDYQLENPGEIYSALGEAYFANDEFTRAVQAFEMAGETADGEVDPEMKRQAEFQTAWVRYENHAYEQAKQAFESVYQDQPTGELAAEALFWSADSHYNLRQWHGAARRFERFLNEYPGHRYAGAAAYSLGWSYFNMREFDSAIRYFERFDQEYEPPPMALFPYEVDTRLRLGDSFYAMGRYEEAIRNYEEVAGTETGGDYAIFQIGNSYFRQDQTFEAVRSFRRLLRIFPESRLREQAQYNVGHIYFQVGNYDQAIEEFHELINRFPGTEWAARSQYLIGDAFYNAGDYEEAIEAYRTVLDEYPHSTYVLDAINGIQFAQLAGDIEDTSLEILENFLNQHPQTETADQLRYRQAENLLQAGEYQEAINAFSHYIRVTTSESMIPEAWYNIGEAYELLDDYDHAIDAYRHIVNEYPGSDRADPALLHVGSISLEQERYAEAIEALEDLVSREGRLQVEALSILGDAYFVHNNISEAESAYGRALQSREDHERSLIGMGRIAKERGQYMDAEQYFSEVAASSSSERGAEAQYRLGNVEQMRRNFETSLDAYARVSALYEAYDRWVAKAMLAMADSYRQMGQTGRANQTLQDIIERFPGTEYAANAQEQL